MPTFGLEDTDKHIAAVYQTYCTQFESIMTRRFQLLTIAPGSTVASFAITLVSNPVNNKLQYLIIPLGLAGIGFLIGLFVVACISFRAGRVVYNRIQKVENDWGIPQMMHYENGNFTQEVVASLIFSVSLAGWVCVTLWFLLPFPILPISISCVLTIPFFIFSRRILLDTRELPNRDNAQQTLGNVPIHQRQG